MADQLQPPTQPPPTTTPAGWYADPNDGTAQRYWDGRAWTQQTAPLPPKVEGAGPQGQPFASFGARLGAYALDSFLVLLGFVAIALPILWNGTHQHLLRHQAWPVQQMFLVTVGMAPPFLLNFVILPGLTGQTLGKKIVGIRIVRIDGAKRLGYGTAFLRSLVWTFASTLAFGLGFLWALWDDKRQTWHDKAAGTVVVKSR